MNWSVLLHRSERFKAQAPFGHVEHRSTVILFQLQKCKFVGHFSEILTLIQIYVP